MPKQARRVMLFDLYSTGHHLQYLSQLASFWVSNNLPGQLDIVVPTSFTEAHPSFLAFVREQPAEARITLVTIEEQLPVRDPGTFQLLRDDLTHGRLLKKYITKLRPDHCLIMWFDHVQLSLAMGLRFDFPVKLSGIYFRPSFHYRHFSHDRSGLHETFRRLRKKLVLKAALRNPNFSTLFSLDPYAVPHIRSRETNVVFLPDGFAQEPLDHDWKKLDKSHATHNTMRHQWGVENGRQAILFFGGIDGRKGVIQILDAIRYISVENQEKLCLVFIGVIQDSDREQISSRFENVRASSATQLVVQEGFVDEMDIQCIIRSADLVLVAYQRHVGSSGVLIRAAAERIPILGSDYGLIGEYIRRHRLGLSVDTTSSRTIAAAMTRFITDRNDIGFDAEKAHAFARENTAEQFCSTIFDDVLKNRRE